MTRRFLSTVVLASGLNVFYTDFVINGQVNDVGILDANVSDANAQSSSEQQSSAEQNSPRENAPSLQDARDPVYYSGDTESPKSLARKLGGNILLDQKEIWTSPFHMHADDAKWWLGVGALTGALIATDRRTSKSFENSAGQVTWGNNISRIGASYTLIPVVAGFYSFGVFDKDPKAREVAVLGGEAMLDSLIVVSVLKPAVGRQRPNATGERGSFFDGGDSFPSGHAIEVWSLASVISYEYGHTKLVPIIACGLAGVVSAARFAAQQHYASDLVAGGAMGWFIGRYVWKTHQDHALHPHGRLQAQIVPQLHPASRTYAVAVMLGN